jgi:zinc transport system substrate-binding protein
MLRRILLAGSLAVLTACGADPAPVTQSPAGSAPVTPSVDVVVGFYPLQFLTERIGGPHVAVTNVTQPGVEPHDMELKPSQVLEVNEAELVIYLKTFQPELDKAVEQKSSGKSFDVTTVSPLVEAPEHEHEGEEEHEEESGLDPHLWLDPTRFATVADAIATELGKADSAHASVYVANAAALRAELTALDQEYSAGLAQCQRREIFASHAAYGYLASRYKLEQIGLTGLSPENEPTPKRLTEIAEEAKEHGATTIFFETLVSPKIADTIAKEVGAKTAVLDPIEGLEAGSTENYLTVMRANLTALRTALGCS